MIKCVGIVDGTTRVEGFTIEGGGNVSQGAGIYISAGSVVKIINNKIVDNINSEAAGGAGAGIYVMSSSPVISDNFISGNDAGWQVSTGGAIYVSNASSAMVISNNTITGNSPGDYSVEAGGIDIIDCSPLIIGNFISGNSGYYGNASGLRINGSSSSPRILNNIITKNGEGIECKGSAKPSIINNTISDNNNDGILIYSANPDSIMNNILSLNSGYGIREYNSSSDPGKVWYNLFYANSSGLYCDEGSTDYYTLNSLNTGVTECESNIDGDPGFVDRINDDYHLRAGSPAIDSGDPTLDYSNEPSPNGGRINIGGYGNTTEAATSDAGPPALPESLYVDAMNGNNATGDGFSGNPWQTITYALSQISNSSHTVYVAAGTYDTSLGETFPVLMKDSVSLVGVGMDLSIVDAGGNNRVISCVGIVDPSTKVQGFTLKGGGNVDQGAGLFISAGSVLEIVDNRITGNSNISYAGKGGGIYVENSSPSILNNTITGNSAGPQFAVAGGIYTLNSFSLIQNNTISGNTGTGIYVVAASPLIHANIIKWNTLTTLYDGKDGSGLYVSGSSSSPRISQNVIANNAKEGIECETSANPVIINNTISENSDNGIYISLSVPDSIFNNILSLNSEYGIYENGSSSDPGKVWYNLFYANSSGLYCDEGTTDYYTANSLNAGVAECENNIDGDPMFVDRVNGDYRLSLGSPAIDAGDPDPQFNDPDGSRNDMGAYYYVGLSSENDILTFSFPEQTGTANIDNVNHTVDIEVAYDTDVSALIATFTISNWATITIGSTPQESGITANDFTNPVTYTVTAENGTTQDWMVTVTVATSLSSENDILTYSFAEQTGAATIDDVNYTVDIEVAYGTDVSGLVATFTISDLATIAVGATTQVSGITANDF
ncbi:MAG: right-handed parallel beta-helix repeat-containing protein, partial [Candidatus Cloacimonetes bacterium]|nr:right-handed parallel beta-helix repeat-containing protein [Candidatus Cloacimonadota bacterium]